MPCCDLATSAGRKQVYRKPGVLFHNPDDQILNATVYDDVALGPLNMGLDPVQVRRRVDEAMAHVGQQAAHGSDRSDRSDRSVG